MTEFLKFIANIFGGEDNNELEQFIINNQPESVYDVDHLEREYNRRRFTDMGRYEYYPVTR